MAITASMKHARRSTARRRARKYQVLHAIRVHALQLDPSHAKNAHRNGPGRFDLKLVSVSRWQGRGPIRPATRRRVVKPPLRTDGAPPAKGSKPLEGRGPGPLPHHPADQRPHDTPGAVALPIRKYGRSIPSGILRGNCRPAVRPEAGLTRALRRSSLASAARTLPMCGQQAESGALRPVVPHHPAGASESARVHGLARAHRSPPGRTSGSNSDHAAAHKREPRLGCRCGSCGGRRGSAARVPYLGR